MFCKLGSSVHPAFLVHFHEIKINLYRIEKSNFIHTFIQLNVLQNGNFRSDIMTKFSKLHGI